MTMAYVNCRSINRNGFKLKDCVVDNDYDLIGITETWLPIEQSLSNHIIRDFCPKGYKMVHIPRSSSQRGGGVGILHKDTLDLKITETVNTFASFECIERLLKLDSTWIRVVVVYRPPVSSVNALSVSMFLSEFSVYLENLVLLPGEVLIMGDFNFHTDDLANHNACEFSNLLDTFNMSQHVSEPTHQSGHTLDLLITR
jgi:exonuclease III